VPAAAPAVGPALSGIVLSGLSWRWLFILMLPVTLIALALGAWKLRNIGLAAVLGTFFVRRPPAVTEPAQPAPAGSTASSDTNSRARAATG
jgi:MFS family permease